MTAKIDWCTCTFAFQEGKTTLGELLEDLSDATGLQLIAEGRRGRPGYANGIQVKALIDYEPVNFAVFAWGGESQRGRAMLDFSGECCGCIDDWRLFRRFLEGLPESRLTRVDIAVDLMNGEFTVDDAVTWHAEGLFNVGGRNPKTRTDGDWLERIEGRTLYIGKTCNGKGLRAYEKGKQLGDLLSKWVRFEVQFGNRDRILPFDMLTSPDAFFASAYPALEQILGAGGERVETIQEQTRITVGRLLSALRRTYGKSIHLLKSGGIDDAELIEEIRIHALPSRIQASAVAQGAIMETVRGSFEQWRTMRE